MPPRPISRADEGIFRRLHEQVIGRPVDLSGLHPEQFSREQVNQAQRVWQERTRSEFRSIQIMIRFLTEVVGAGETLDVYAGALELVEDEIRHTAMCASVCQAFGLQSPLLPDPVPLVDPEPFLKAPMAERALATAISMLAINETLSVGYIADLEARCANPAIHAVLAATVGDEAEHEQFGWEYIRMGLSRFPASTLRDWRHLVETTLQPHRQQAAQVLQKVPTEKRTLEAWPDEALVALGLLSPVRQALVYQRTYETVLAPRLRELGLL